jgi:type IV secretion system protein VirB2
MSKLIAFCLTFAFVVVIASTAYAAATIGGGTMPWATPLQNLRADITGPTASALALVGVVLVMGILIFGGELNHFGRSICFIILTASVLVGGNNILTGIGIAGATVDPQAGFDLYGFICGVIISSLIWALGIIWQGWWRRRVARLEQTNVVLGVAAHR